jgi:hypothetical protein
MKLHGDGTIEFPNGTQNKPADVGPAFSYQHVVSQSVPNGGIVTKLNFTAKEFDTDNAVANSRFQPQKAGYYFIKASYYPAAPIASGAMPSLTLYKNTLEKIAGVATSAAGSAFLVMECCGLVYLNGATDYVEVYVTQNTASALNSIADQMIRFQGFMARNV